PGPSNTAARMSELLIVGCRLFGWGRGPHRVHGGDRERHGGDPGEASERSAPAIGVRHPPDPGAGQRRPEIPRGVDDPRPRPPAAPRPSAASPRNKNVYGPMRTTATPAISGSATAGRPSSGATASTPRATISATSDGTTTSPYRPPNRSTSHPAPSADAAPASG